MVGLSCPAGGLLELGRIGWRAVASILLVCACAGSSGEEPSASQSGSGGSTTAASGSSGTASAGGGAASTSGGAAGTSSGSGGATSAKGGAQSQSGGASDGGRPSSGGVGPKAGSAGAVAGTGSGGARSGTGGTAGETGAQGGAAGGEPSTGGNANNGGAASGGQQGLPPGVTALFPAPNASGVCPDPALRVTFSAPPTLGSSGKVQVYEASGTLVASVDLGAKTLSDSIDGTTFSRPLPAFVDGNSAVIYLKNKALGYGHSYYVTIDAGAIRPPAGGSFSLSGSSAWRFSTAAAAPENLTALTVSTSGGGEFCSVQGALDALPANNSVPTRITIKSGTYHELIHMSSKSNITLHGEDRKLTLISGVNNENLNGGTAKRALVGFDRMNGLVIENLTIHNLTPQGGSQAEALRMQNCDKCIVRDADILSLQDTLLWSGRIYAENCYIAGNVDYVWGTGAAYFNKCELRTVGRSGVLVQARNAAGAFGYVFVDSKLTADSLATNNLLARIDVSAYPGSQVAFIDCQMSNIAAAGWTISGGTPSSSLRFWEYGSVDANGKAIDTSGRVAGSKRISAAEAASLRDVTQVLGGWQPAMK